MWFSLHRETPRTQNKVSELLRLICEANLDSFSRRSLEERASAARNAQASLAYTVGRGVLSAQEVLRTMYSVWVGEHLLKSQLSY